MQLSIIDELKPKLLSSAVVTITIAIVLIPISGYALWIWSRGINRLIQAFQYIAELHSDSTLLELADSARWTYILWVTAGLVIPVILVLVFLYASLIIFDIISIYRDKLIWKSNQATLIEVRCLEKLIIKAAGGRARYVILIGIPSITSMSIAALLFLFSNLSPFITLLLPACIGISGTAILAFTHSRKIVVKQNLPSQTIKTIIRLEAQTIGIAVVTFLLIVSLLLIGIPLIVNNTVPRFLAYGVDAWTPVINQASAYLESTQIQSIQRYLDTHSGLMNAPVTVSGLIEESGINLFIWFCVAVFAVFLVLFPFIFQDLRVYKSRRWQIISGVTTAILVFFGMQLIAHLLQKDLVFLPPFLASLVAAIYTLLLIQYFKNLPYPRASSETQLCPNPECHYENRVDATYCGACGAHLKSISDDY